MIKQKSEKLEKWTTRNIVNNVVVYVVNAIVITLLFILTVFLNAIRTPGVDIEDYFKDLQPFMNFTIMLVVFLSVMAVYFYFEDRNFFKRAVNSEMMFLTMEISLLVCYFIGAYVNEFLRPFAMAGILIAFLANKRSALFINIIFCSIIFMTDTFANVTTSFGSYMALIIGIPAGTVAIFVLEKVYSRFKLLIFGFFTSVPVLICGIAIIAESGWKDVVASLFSCVFSGTVTSAVVIIIMPLFEAMFKKVTTFKLAELADHKSRLISKLITEAPGTFNHSIVVSNIAEACATAIGEDALLARVCAYYHDIGKLRRPEFFSENQTGGINPHNDLTPELSTNIIKSHAQDGYTLVTKNRLPEEIADVCVQHHGTMPILYFYDKAKKYTDGEVDITRFCYPGPKPQSKIAAIIMIADGCEAASRTLKERSRENVRKVVRKIVNDRMGMGQFDECELTIKELNIIIHTIVNNLTGVYHSRLEYPKVNLNGVDLDKDGDK